MIRLVVRLINMFRWKVLGLWFSGLFLCERLRNNKVVVFYVALAGQAVYVAPVIRKLIIRKDISCYLAYGDGLARKARTVPEIPRNKIMNIEICREARNIDAFVSPDQWEGGNKHIPLRICMFHGQPSKGITFLRENMRSFNTLFLLGPLQRSLYDLFSHEHPEIARNIQALNIGYPKMDSQLRCTIDRKVILNKLGLNPAYKTVIYAPAWDQGCSLRTYGTQVITRLLEVPEINVIVKLHPAMIVPPQSPHYYFYTGGIDWVDRIKVLERECARLRYIEVADTSAYFGACDVMVTDFSTIALEFMLLDKPVVYIHCPEFFEHTLKEHGCDPFLIKEDMRYNAGRNYGVVADGLSAMVNAVKRSLDNPDELSTKRKDLTSLLLYNPGHATEVAADTILNMLHLAPKQ